MLTICLSVHITKLEHGQFCRFLLIFCKKIRKRKEGEGAFTPWLSLLDKSCNEMVLKRKIISESYIE